MPSTFQKRSRVIYRQESFPPGHTILASWYTTVSWSQPDPPHASLPTRWLRFISTSWKLGCAASRWCPNNNCTWSLPYSPNLLHRIWKSRESQKKSGWSCKYQKSHWFNQETHLLSPFSSFSVSSNFHTFPISKSLVAFSTPQLPRHLSLLLAGSAMICSGSVASGLWDGTNVRQPELRLNDTAMQTMGSIFATC
jgi:hypothetical protein